MNALTRTHTFQRGKGQPVQNGIRHSSCAFGFLVKMWNNTYVFKKKKSVFFGTASILMANMDVLLNVFLCVVGRLRRCSQAA